MGHRMTAEKCYESEYHQKNVMIKHLVLLGNLKSEFSIVFFFLSKYD